MSSARDIPSKEFWDKAKDLIAWCSPEELRVLRVMAATELEKRIKKWDDKLDAAVIKSKAKKHKAIKRRLCTKK